MDRYGATVGTVSQEGFSVSRDKVGQGGSGHEVYATVYPDGRVDLHHGFIEGQVHTKPAPPAEAVAKLKAKEPWQMTPDEFGKNYKAREAAIVSELEAEIKKHVE